MSEQLLEGLAEGLVVRPGDTLIVRVRGGLSEAAFDQIRAGLDGLRELMPGVEIVCVGGAIEQIAVHRSDEGAPV